MSLPNSNSILSILRGKETPLSTTVKYHVNMVAKHAEESGRATDAGVAAQHVTAMQAHKEAARAGMHQEKGFKELSNNAIGQSDALLGPRHMGNSNHKSYSWPYNDTQRQTTDAGIWHSGGPGKISGASHQWGSRYANEKSANLAEYLTPAAIVVTPFLHDWVKNHKQKGQQSTPATNVPSPGNSSPGNAIPGGSGGVAQSTPAREHSDIIIEANIPHLLNTAYQLIWPEGPKTMASDAADIVRVTSDPVKRQQVIDNAKLIPGYLQGRTREIGQGIGNFCKRCLNAISPADSAAMGGHCRGCYSKNNNVAAV